MTIFKDTKTSGTFADRVRKAVEPRPESEPYPSPARQQEKRLARQPVFAPATLVFAGTKLPATVTNVNALGARVEFTTNVTLQGDVVLVAPMLDLNRRVRIAWQKGGSAGLIFVKQEEDAG